MTLPDSVALPTWCALPTSVTLPTGVKDPIRWVKVLRVGVVFGVVDVARSGFLSKNRSLITSWSVIIRAVSSGYFVKWSVRNLSR